MIQMARQEDGDGYHDGDSGQKGNEDNKKDGDSDDGVEDAWKYMVTLGRRIWRRHGVQVTHQQKRHKLLKIGLMLYTKAKNSNTFHSWNK